ncbi:hypothetical protein T440DRAFT_508140 [Plenodomus tracheiphilus IPT5]|uniref:Cyanovirin-N domain-containing protein n=1 Tax=Plenodomus tracheiphilus IPT5 TaxID=1408161 RepID=A0A6A7B4T7_9PLEO|nr:hypothetical protein T440DRAFT_508140 [Plenodomus tracheiphilus IPT5]
MKLSILFLTLLGLIMITAARSPPPCVTGDRICGKDAKVLLECQHGQFKRIMDCALFNQVCEKNINGTPHCGGHKSTLDGRTNDIIVRDDDPHAMCTEGELICAAAADNGYDGGVFNASRTPSRTAAGLKPRAVSTDFDSPLDIDSVRFSGVLGGTFLDTRVAMAVFT